MKAPHRPALRYLGGKYRLAPWIVSHLPPHKTYVEPYGGGGASVLLRKPIARAEVYNDMDTELVNFFTVLRDPDMAERLARLAELTPFSRAEWQAAYEATDDAVERARRLLVRSFQGFGSCASRIDRITGWRTGQRLESASAARDWAGYPEVIPHLHWRLRRVSLECRPALEVIASYDGPGVLFYVDPPYMHSTRSPKRTRTAPSNGYAHELNDADHVALLDVLLAVTGYVVLSGYTNELYDERLKGWTRLVRDTHADGARDRTEVLWINPAAAMADGLFAGAAA